MSTNGEVVTKSYLRRGAAIRDAAKHGIKGYEVILDIEEQKNGLLRRLFGPYVTLVTFSDEKKKWGKENGKCST